MIRLVRRCEESPASQQRIQCEGAVVQHPARRSAAARQMEAEPVDRDAVERLMHRKTALVSPKTLPPRIVRKRREHLNGVPSGYEEARKN